MRPCPRSSGPQCSWRHRRAAWAGVIRPDKGFGVHNRLHSATGEYETDTPIVVEVIDTAAKVQEMLPFLDEVVEEGLITTEGVRLLRYGPWPAEAGQ